MNVLFALDHEHSGPICIGLRYFRKTVKHRINIVLHAAPYISLGTAFSASVFVIGKTSLLHELLIAASRVLLIAHFVAHDVKQRIPAGRVVGVASYFRTLPRLPIGRKGVELIGYLSKAAPSVAVQHYRSAIAFRYR
ncbi:hypothetical protein [Salinibacter ruber]|uniref:hypothetical protein n=1 Tax=Salinibacter ruber TaxID=146919 RepID=UPI0021691CFE|nr:hypothetical protein [Salinibacter ruber]